MESQWLAMAKRLQAIAETGLQFSADQYDQERYQEVSDIAFSMLSLLGQVPIEPVKDLFSTNESGYVTPKIEVRAAIFQNNQVLLVQEKEDGLWAMPGGYADVGLSAAENVEKEVLEEAGIAVKATHLYALRHKAKGDYPADARDFYKLHFLCEATSNAVPRPGAETQDARFFPLDQLPPLALAKILAEDIHSAWRFFQSGSQITQFD